MKLLETAISETHVRMLLADADTKEAANQWIEFRVPVSALVDQSGTKQPLGSPESHFVGGVQLAALFQALTVIADETQRLRSVADRTL
jgi:hypothetical protein